MRLLNVFTATALAGAVALLPAMGQAATMRHHAHGRAHIHRVAMRHGGAGATTGDVAVDRLNQQQLNQIKQGGS